MAKANGGFRHAKPNLHRFGSGGNFGTNPDWQSIRRAGERNGGHLSPSYERSSRCPLGLWAIPLLVAAGSILVGRPPLGLASLGLAPLGVAPPLGLNRNEIPKTALVLSDGDSPSPQPPCRRSKPLCEERGGFFYGFVSRWTAVGEAAVREAVRHKLTMSRLLALCGFALLAQHAATPESSNVQGDHLVAGLLMLTTVVIVWCLSSDPRQHD